MYAQFATAVRTQDEASRRLDTAAASPEFAGGYLLGQLGHDRFAALTLSANGGEFVVEDEWAGHDPDAAPQAMAVIWFDGPLAEPVLDGARYGGEHRLTPAIQATPGTVRGFALFDPDRRAVCVLNLVTSVDALDDLAKAVSRTELLPGEDPALLPGPDRVETYRVLSYSVASVV
jgi:hypothetical protein